MGRNIYLERSQPHIAKIYTTFRSSYKKKVQQEIK